MRINKTTHKSGTFWSNPKSSPIKDLKGYIAGLKNQTLRLPQFELDPCITQTLEGLTRIYLSAHQQLPTQADRMKFLNIYGQTTWHDDASIVGTKEELARLKHLINSALCHDADSADFFDSEGEGYTVKVVIATEEEGKDVVAPATLLL